MKSNEESKFTFFGDWQEMEAKGVPDIQDTCVCKREALKVLVSPE